MKINFLVLVRLRTTRMSDIPEMTSGVSVTVLLAWLDAGYTLTNSSPYCRWQFGALFRGL